MSSLADRLAVMRTELANERTLLAYGRTALALAAGGLAIIQVFTTPLMVALGWVCIPLGVLVLLVGWLRYHAVRRRLAAYDGAGEPTPAGRAPST